MPRDHHYAACLIGVALLAAWPGEDRAPGATAPAFVVAPVSVPAPGVPRRLEPLPLPLPLRPSPSPATTNPRWSALLIEADGGNPQAACRLAELLDDCRLAREVLHMAQTQIDAAAAARESGAADAEAIVQLEASVATLSASCAAVPPELRARSWDYLLRAAVAGHEASMLRFLADPPLDAQPTDERAFAQREYRAHAELLLTLLLQRGSPAALTLAFRAAQGEALGRFVPAPKRDPAAVVRLGTALLVLREADENAEEIVARAAREVPPRGVDRAREEGYALALRYLSGSADLAATSASNEDCARGWPGMAPESTAFSW